MKKVKILFLASLLIGISAIAMTSKVEKPIGIQEGTTVGQYSKPGAPVDITYTTEHVEVGDISQVHIVLSSVVKSGSMNVTLHVDSNLNQIVTLPENISFDMGTGQREYPLDLSVSADRDGLYYVKLIVSIEDKGIRTFAVPVYVGDKKLYKNSNKVPQKTASGENISVSKAVETIER